VLTENLKNMYCITTLFTVSFTTEGPRVVLTAALRNIITQVTKASTTEDSTGEGSVHSWPGEYNNSIHHSL
jgi:hypothetical protein